MNHENSGLVKTEIIKQLGYFPAFLFPAINSSLIYRSLVKQTLFAYINNPLPQIFKEKLFVFLSRYFGVSYFTICHSCTLNSLGVSSTAILALENIRYPTSEADLEGELEALAQRKAYLKNWKEDQQAETSLLRCSSLLFTYPEQTTKLTSTLKEILGDVCYHYLIILLGYIRLCHEWTRRNPQISHKKDRRSQLYLGSMLLEENRLPHFLQANLQANQFHSVSSPSIVYPSSPMPVKVLAKSDVLQQNNLVTCLANAPFPVMIHTKSGEIVYLNHNWISTTGYDPSEISTVSQWIQKAKVKRQEILRLPHKQSSRRTRTRCVPPACQTKMELTDELQQVLDALFNQDSTSFLEDSNLETKLPDAMTSEVIIHTSEGKQLFWELYSAVICDPIEEKELTVSIAKDLTEMVLHDNRLAEMESKLRLVLEATKTGSWSWNLVTNQVDICHRGRLILGLENFDGTYEGFLQSIHPDEREAVDLDAAKAIQKHQNLELNYSVVKGNQEIVQIKAQGKLCFSAEGRAIRLSGILTDVTSKKCTESNNLEQPYGKKVQALAELESIINLLPYYLMVVDVKTKAITLINDELANTLQLKITDAIGSTINQCFSVDYVNQIALQHQQVIAFERPLRVQEEVTFRDNIHYLDTVVTPLYDDTGEIYALLRTSSNIPDLAATQEALSQRTLQLEAANKELESFSYSVSHDLQAPLRVINGFSQVLWENYQPNLDDQGRHYLQRIQANSKRMSDLIDALLQLSRVTRSQMKSVRVNLSALAWDIIEEMQAESPKRTADFIIAEGLETKGDPNLLRVVLSNLLNNSWKYTSKQPSAQIEFGVIRENPSQITYYVKDNGVGFDQMYADRLFTAFQRLHSQSEFPGTGIGLATVQRIIFRHGGKVWAEGEQDQGAAIYFSL